MARQDESDTKPTEPYAFDIHRTRRFKEIIEKKYGPSASDLITRKLFAPEAAILTRNPDAKIDPIISSLQGAFDGAAHRYLIDATMACTLYGPGNSVYLGAFHEFIKIVEEQKAADPNIKPRSPAIKEHYKNLIQEIIEQTVALLKQNKRRERITTWHSWTPKKHSLANAEIGKNDIK